MQASYRMLPEAALTCYPAADGFAAAVNAANGAAAGVGNDSSSSDVPKVLLVDETTAAATDLPPDDAVNVGAAFDWDQVRAISCAVEQHVIAQMDGARGWWRVCDSASC